MNKSVKNGLIIATIILAIIFVFSFLSLNDKENAKDEWVTIENHGEFKSINILPQNVTFNMPSSWQSMSNKEPSDIAKFYGEYDKSSVGVAEGVGDGCQFWSYQKDKVANVDNLRKIIEIDLQKMRYEFGVENWDISEITVLNRPTVTVKYKNEGWGNFIDYYILDKESVRVLSLIYGDRKAISCHNIFVNIVESFKINDK